MSYKRHPQGLELFSIPLPIIKQYENSCMYEYIDIEGGNIFPIPWVALEGLKNNNIDISTVPLVEYKKGFLKGYSTLIPFIDTHETRKEVVLNEAIFKGYSSFNMTVTVDIDNRKRSGTVTKESIYKSGITEGKRYKAWEVIFETPSIFLDKIMKLQSNSDENGESEERTSIKEHFECLSGKWKNIEIMESDEYSRLIDYAEFTYQNGQLPDNVQSIKKGTSLMPELFLRHTIYLFWKKEFKTNPKHRQALWISFYKTIFPSYVANINGDWSKNFSKSNTFYESDKKNITY
jgi:hypothetical protein